MRWRSREGPWGSHQLDASALKCDTSVGSTEDLGGTWGEDWVEEKRTAVVVEGIRWEMGLRVGWLDLVWMVSRCRVRRALLELEDAITAVLWSRKARFAARY